MYYSIIALFKILIRLGGRLISNSNAGQSYLQPKYDDGGCLGKPTTKKTVADDDAARVKIFDDIFHQHYKIAGMDLRVAYEDLENKGFDAGGGEILHYKGKPFTGTIVEYRNGFLVGEEQFTNGHIGGAQRTYYANGQLMKEHFIIYNTHYGLYREWDEQGNVTHQQDFGLKPWSVCLATDVYYTNGGAKVVGVGADLSSEEVKFTETVYLDNVDDYKPGEFYKRELPCLLKMLKQVDTKKLAAIIVDGHVYVDDSGAYGLGGKLWEGLDRWVPVIGVAKNAFAGNGSTVTEVYRGDSKKPLYVSAIGISQHLAVQFIANLKGYHRMPDLLKIVDSLSKQY